MFRSGHQTRLRALKAEDIPVWRDWFNSAEVTRNMNKGMFPVSEERQREIFDSLVRSRSDVQLGVVLKEGKGRAGSDPYGGDGYEEGSLVGIVGIHKIDWIHRTGDMSIVIGEARCRGRGVGTEAIALMTAHGFEKLNLRKITAGMWATNEGSRRSFEKNGYLHEATIKESFFCESGYVDEYRLGIFRADWKSMRKEGRG